MAAMELEVQTTEVVTSLPPCTESIFLCSEKDEVCHHACGAHNHKIHWSNTTFLENDSDVEDLSEGALSGSISSILDTFQRRTSNLSALTQELLQAAQTDFEDALADAIVENFMREYGIEVDEPLADRDDEAMEDLDGPEEDFESDVINRILGNCVNDSSSDDEDDGDDMFLSPPHVRRQFGSMCAYDSDNTSDNAGDGGGPGGSEET